MRFVRLYFTGQIWDNRALLALGLKSACDSIAQLPPDHHEADSGRRKNAWPDPNLQETLMRGLLSPQPWYSFSGPLRRPTSRRTTSFRREPDWSCSTPEQPRSKGA